MIAYPLANPAGIREQWADRLFHAMHSASVGLHDLPPDAVREVAHGVATYLDERLPPGTPVESERLIALAAQALVALGETRLARRLLIFGCGLVRPAEWAVGGDQTMLVLDLNRLAVRREDRLEIVLFRALSVCLDGIADTWDPSGGDGTLGLSHVDRAARQFVPPRRATPRRIAAFADEIVQACRHHLAAIGARRGWTTAPHVLILDAIPTHP